jgi:autotransporter adhesin
LSTQGAASFGSVGNERQLTNVAGGTQATDAVNVRQLESVQASSVQYASRADGSVNYGNVTLGNGQAPAGTTLSNVAPGVTEADAVNVSQLNAGVAGANRYTDTKLQDLQNSINGVAKKAYAGVAAAIAMESAPFLPGKLTYAAGMGYYQSQTALGVSLRRTADNGRWSISGGVSATGAGGVATRVAVSGVFN